MLEPNHGVHHADQFLGRRLNDFVHIPGRDIVQLLLSEGKRKPAVQALIDDVASLSDEDIAAATVPMKWYRDALKKLRRKAREQAVFAETSLLIDANTVDGVVDDPSGAVYRWDGNTQFIAVDRGGALEVRTGDLIWMPEYGGVWFDTSYSKHVDPALASAYRLGVMAKTEYSQACRDKRSRLSPTEAAPPFTIQKL